MDTNPVIDMLGRHLRLAVIGGGPGSFIGAMHRTAARLDDRFEVVAGVLSSNPVTNTLAEAREMLATVEETDLVLRGERSPSRAAARRTRRKR